MPFASISKSLRNVLDDVTSLQTCGGLRKHTDATWSGSDNLQSLTHEHLKEILPSNNVSRLDIYNI